jgi:osmotically inducible lipoprotein OsmB
MTRIMSFSCVVAVALTLGACGERPGERALSGGGLGAAGGAGIAAVTGGSLLTGALIGGAAGALTGAATSPDQVNLDPSGRR